MREGHTGRRSGARRDGEGCGTMRKDDAMRPSPSAGQRVQRGSPVCSKAKSEGLRVPMRCAPHWGFCPAPLPALGLPTGHSRAERERKKNHF